MTPTSTQDPLPRPWLRFYPSGVPHRPAVPDVAVPHLLEEAARRHGRRTALVFLGRRIRYRALHRSVRRCAASLARLGVRRGDRVAVVLPNCPQAVVVWHAALRLGAVVLPLAPDTPPDVLGTRIRAGGAVLAVAADSVCATLAALRPRTAVRRVVAVPLVGALSLRSRAALRLPTRRARALRERFAAQPPLLARAFVPYAATVGPRLRRASARPGPGPRELAVLQYTDSGAVMLTHGNLVAAAHQARAWCPRLREGRETVLSAVPLWQPHGLLFALTAPALAGAATVLEPFPSAGTLLRTARRTRPALLLAAPAAYREILERPAHEREALASVGTCLSSAPLDPATGDLFRRTSGVPLVEGHGRAEASGLLLANPLDANARPGTAGLPVPGTEIRIVREGASVVDVEPGLAGELLARGPQVCAGYWRDPAATARRLLPGGWLRTGDIAVAGPDGYVTVIDRTPYGASAPHLPRAAGAVPGSAA